MGIDFYENSGPGNYPESLTPSPSGIMQLTKEGHALLKKIQIDNSEAPIVWISHIAQCIPQLEQIPIAKPQIPD
jgi:hypothetical protein